MKPFHALLSAFTVGSASALTPATDLIYGHFEIHVDYTPTPGNPDAGWGFSASYDEDDDFSTSNGVVRMTPAQTVYVASPRSRTVVPSPAGNFSRFGPPGTPLWILPQNQALGTLYLGVRTTMPAGLFQASVGGNYTPSTQGSISLRLISVTGTGPDAGGKFATWKTESQGTTVFSFDTTDGITAADAIGTIPVSSHTHYNWGFTKPGTYEVTLEARGKLMPQSGAVTSGRETFRFSVPFSSTLGSGASLRVVGSEGPLQLAAADPAASVAYAPDRVLLETIAATPASAALEGAQWESSFSLSTAEADIANGVGIDPLRTSQGMPPGDWTEVELEVLSVEGPGRFAWIADGTMLAGDPGDRIALTPGAARELRAAFSATGLYRIGIALHGVKQGVRTSSLPMTLVYGAGIGVDFDYAAWCSSFERTAGLAAGTLADSGADYDGDGISNGLEFAFFWHGLSPVVADSGKMPLPSSADGSARIDFLRDTYKDPLDETGWQIRPGVSTDLVNWSYRSSRVPGFPLQISETGAEEGNAHGRIMRRQLRVMPTPVPGAFFRFEAKSH